MREGEIVCVCVPCLIRVLFLSPESPRDGETSAPHRHLLSSLPPALSPPQHSLRVEEPGSEACPWRGWTGAAHNSQTRMYTLTFCVGVCVFLSSKSRVSLLADRAPGRSRLEARRLSCPVPDPTDPTHHPDLQRVRHTHTHIQLEQTQT